MVKFSRTEIDAITSSANKIANEFLAEEKRKFEAHKQGVQKLADAIFYLHGMRQWEQKRRIVHPPIKLAQSSIVIHELGLYEGISALLMAVGVQIKIDSTLDSYGTYQASTRTITLKEIGMLGTLAHEAMHFLQFDWSDHNGNGHYNPYEWSKAIGCPIFSNECQTEGETIFLGQVFNDGYIFDQGWLEIPAICAGLRPRQLYHMLAAHCEQYYLRKFKDLEDVYETSPRAYGYDLDAWDTGEPTALEYVSGFVEKRKADKRKHN